MIEKRYGKLKESVLRRELGKGVSVVMVGKGNYDKRFGVLRSGFG